LCCLKHYILLALTLVISSCMYWGCLAWLTTRPWYTGGTGNTYKVCCVPPCAVLCRAVLCCAVAYMLGLHWGCVGHYLALGC